MPGVPGYRFSREASGCPPDVRAEELHVERVRAAIGDHGYLRVQGLFSPEAVAHLTRVIDAAFAAADRFHGGQREPSEWFAPFRPDDRFPDEVKRKIGNKRKFVRDAGGVWAADSPRGLFELFEALHTVGLGEVITEYLGERPAIALDKCTFRLVGPDSDSDWHQDGAFLGADIRTLNVWITLSECGRDAPGLDLVPKRFDRLVEAGTEGAFFWWSVGQGVVDREARDAPVVRPEFAAGDVMLFDQFFLHRTAADPSMTRSRYAIETWFFAPSTYPEGYVPLLF